MKIICCYYSLIYVIQNKWRILILSVVMLVGFHITVCYLFRGNHYGANKQLPVSLELEVS
jgi:hypothetical protein